MSVVTNKAAKFDGVAIGGTEHNNIIEEGGRDNVTKKTVLGLKIGLIVVTGIAAILLCVMIWAVVMKKDAAAPPNLGFVQASATIASNMDENADPCQDFAQYACGGWTKKNVIPGDSDQVSNFLKLRDETEVKLYNLLTSLQESEDSNPEFLEKLLNFYTSCTNTAAMDAADDEDLIKTTVKQILDAAELSEVIKIVTKYDIQVFVALYVDGGNRNSDINSIYMVQGALGLKQKKEYNNTDPDVSIKEKQGYYKKYLKGLWENYDDTSGEADNIVEKMWEFESCAAEGMKIPEDERASFLSMPSKSYSEVLGTAFASEILIEDQFSSRMSDDKTLEDGVTVYYHDSYVSKVGSCVTEHLSDLGDFKNYVATRYMMSYAEVAKKSWRDLSWAYSKDVTKISVKPSRWKTCVKIMTLYMPESVGRVFVQENFKEDAKKKTLEMIKDVKTAFKEILPSLDWMDDETRAAAIEKADMVSNKIGYEDWILDDVKLNKYVSLMEMDLSNLLSNTMSGDRAIAVRTFDAAGEEVDQKKWYMSPATVNAYYSLKGNEMVFPAAILQPPFYHMNYPNYVNYGAIGVVIGHELTHGFDDQGRKNDKNGHLNEWYTDEAKAGFKERAKCMVDQYSGYEILGNKVNGNLTLGENIADNGGVKQSYIAYQNWVRQNGDEEPLPGLSLTNEQAFFVSYAQIWCQKKTDEAYKRMIEEDPHSPGVFRVRGAVVNSKEFAKAFDCKLGDPMNPKDKCEVW